MSGLALIPLTLVGYSSGAVLAGKGKQVSPGVLDLAAIGMLWAIAFATQTALGKGRAILIWLILSLIVGAGLTGLRRRRYRGREKKGSTNSQKVGRPQRWWRRWKALVLEIGNYQARVLLSLFYFVAVTPFAVPLCLFGDPLRLRRVGGSSFWVQRQLSNYELDKARQQF